eukprot:3061123-Amphidinium_carterae.1
MRYRTILMSTSLIYALVNCLSVICYKRINVEYGISDKPFVLASNALQTVLGQIAWMPMTVMFAQLVPKGIESVMLAMLSSSLNYGYQVANYGGALVLQQLGVTPDGSQNEDLLALCFDPQKRFLTDLMAPDLKCKSLLLVSCHWFMTP